MEQPEKKEDLRIRRTYKLLFKALVAMLEEQPFEKISVTDICDKAMVHRTTFYKHFEDKYHLLMYGIQELQKDINKKSLTNESYNNPKQYYLDIFANVLKYMSANQKMCSLILARNETDSILSMFSKLMVEEIMCKLKTNEKNGIKHHIPVEIIANFYAGALLSISSWWLRNSESVSIDTMKQYLDLLIIQEAFISTN
jgi:AcrR family transcriptional regulator